MKRPIIAVLLTIVSLSVMQLLFAVYQYPLIGTDGNAFLTASINWANGDGFINNYFYVTRLINAEYPEPAFNHYPPVFPAVHAGFYALTHNIYIGAALINIALMSLFAWLAYKIGTAKLSMASNVLASFIIVFLIAWNTQLNAGEGRPELITQMWMLLLTINILYNRRRIAPLLSGLLIGLIGFTHPVAGIYSLLIVVCYIFYSGSGWKKLIGYAAGGFLSLLVIAMLYPFNMLRMAEGIMQTGKIVMGRGLISFQSFILYHFTSPVYTFFFFVFLLGTSGFACFIHRHYKNIVYKAGFFITFFVFTITCLYFSFQTMEVAYNLYVLFPLFGLCILYLISIARTSAARTAILLLLFSASAGFVRRAILFYAHTKQGISFASAREQLAHYPLSSQRTYASISMFNVVRKPVFLTDDQSDTVQYKLIQQNSSGLLRPVSIPGYEIILNTFIAQPVTIGGFTLASSPPGYQFALYKRIGS